MIVTKTCVGPSLEQRDHIDQVVVLASHGQRGESSPGSVVNVGALLQQVPKNSMVSPTRCIRQRRILCDWVPAVDISPMLQQHFADLTVAVASRSVQVIVAIWSRQTQSSSSA